MTIFPRTLKTLSHAMMRVICSVLMIPIFQLIYVMVQPLFLVRFDTITRAVSFLRTLAAESIHVEGVKSDICDLLISYM